METERESSRRRMQRRNWLAHLWREWTVERRRPIAPAFAKPNPELWSSEDVTAAWLGKSTTAITARRTRDLLRGTKFSEIIELDWNDTIRLSPRGLEVEVTAFRSNHWGARMQYDEHRGYNSYVISRRDQRIIYGADTAM